MADKNNYKYILDSKFSRINPFKKKIWLSSPTMHGKEIRYVIDAYEKNWVSTVGENIDQLEKRIADFIGVKYTVALSSGTAALHMAIKLAAEKLYNSSTGISTPSRLGYGGSLLGRRVFCSDMTFSATVNPIAYEGGEAVFIDSEYDTWNMDPIALDKAFQIYPDVKLIVLAHLYGTPGKWDELKEIADAHGALFIEDAAESLGATYKGKQTGNLGDFGCVSFNGNKIITGSSGGLFLTDSETDANKVRKWSTQSREDASWYQHEEIGYNYRMSNIIAGIVRGQLNYLDGHIAAKRKIYERYKEGLADLPVSMNPWDEEKSVPNFWLSCLLVDKEAMCETLRSEREAIYQSEKGKSCPTEILDVLKIFNVEARPIWKPMHAQPVYRNNSFITSLGAGRGRSNAYIFMDDVQEVGIDIFNRGLCLPSDNKMTEEEQDIVINIIRKCFE